MLAQPVLKFLVFTAEEFQSFGHNVGWRRVEELGVVVQIAFDFFLQANLNVCGFRLFQWWFHEWHWVVSFQLTRRGAASIDRKSTRLNSSHLVVSHALFWFY